MFEVDEWGGYAGEMMGAVYGNMGALAYVPDLGPVGSGSAGTYYPRDTSQDARALAFLGFYPEPYASQHVGTRGSRAADAGAGVGAWDEDFRLALTNFQRSVGLTADGWIGPSSRQALAVAVAARNASEVVPVPPPPAPSPFPVPVPPNVLPLPPAPSPGPAPSPSPVAAKDDDKTVMYVGIGVAALAALGLGVWAFSD